MTIDEETVDKIAHLARLELSGKEKQDMIKDMNKILDFMAKLNEVDTTGVEPLVYMTDNVNSLREDVVKQEITHEEALLNAPKHDDDYFLVAKVIESESPKVRKSESQ
jgi:aspartyl-tRNA(Asn)/glutamyl-tRNA(Gln) amidotransferase subunit C